jgi:hypothetical protein
LAISACRRLSGWSQRGAIGLRWLLFPRRYDDGGFSGGTLERPALKRLLAHIETAVSTWWWFIKSIGSAAR